MLLRAQVEALGRLPDGASNAEKQRRFAQLELLRDGADSDTNVRITELQAEVQLDRIPHYHALALLRGCLCFLASLIGAILMVMAAPLVVLHPILAWLHVDKQYFPLDLVQTGVAEMVLFTAGVTLTVEDAHIVDRDARLYLFSHTSSLDGVAVAASAPHSLKMMGKKSLFAIPLIGQAIALYGNIAIDRSNLDRAKASMRRVGEIVQTTGRGVGIAPEGTRSKTGFLLPFKKGAFHVSAQTGTAITPVLIDGTIAMLRPNQSTYFCSGPVTVRFLPKVDPTSLGCDPIRIMQETRCRMLEALASEEPAVERKRHVYWRFYGVVLPLLAVLVTRCIMM